MFAQYIQLGREEWNVLVYYNVSPEDFVEIEDSLLQLDCPEEDIERAFRVIAKSKNTGFTFSNTDYLMSVVCISQATSASEFVSTAIHEAKHVQSHICEYYDIEENSEEAAYLIGYLVQHMYKMVARILESYVRFARR